MENITNTRRIAKNTLMLYFRQLLILLVSLYTVRAVLDALGAQDYGIYNVVAGVVVLFSFVNNAMASATQRFLNFELGRKDDGRVRQVFSASLSIHLLMAAFFVVLAETLGLWFVGGKLNIPAERHGAALAVYQLTIVTTVLNIVRVPYNAAIIAHERMNFFAGISVVETALKLGTVLLLSLAPFDKLVFYAFLLAAVSAAVLVCYKIFCDRNFETARFSRGGDKALIKELFSFSGWSLFGAAANVCNSQGTNIVLNLFFGVAVNAAMGIANQVNAAVYSFVGNFQTAFSPQLVKSWAAEDFEYFRNLIYRASKFSFFLLLVMVVPLHVNAQFVLSVWLKDVPEFAAQFVRLILVYSLVDSLNGPLFYSVQATGNIRKYQVIVSCLITAPLPLSAAALLLGGGPEWVLYMRIAAVAVTTFWRVFFLRHRIGLRPWDFILGTILRCAAVAAVSFLAAELSLALVSGIAGFFLSCAVSVAATGLLVLFVGLSRGERNAVVGGIARKLGGRFGY